MSTTLRFTLEEFDRMIEQGVFDETRRQRIELVHGELREMSPPGPAHEEVIDLLNRWSIQNTDPGKIRIRVQNSIGIPELDSAPQPDVAWVAERSYRSGRPQPADVFLIIEVSDSSLPYDRGEKTELYARAGIADYWIVNIPDWRVEVYRSPSQGAYLDRRICELHESVAPLAVPATVLPVAWLFDVSSPRK